ncbi:Lipid II flippase FtsW, partial [Haemophilus influenzae]
IRLSA